jgi:hypothetical protein
MPPPQDQMVWMRGPTAETGASMVMRAFMAGVLLLVLRMLTTCVGKQGKRGTCGGGAPQQVNDAPFCDIFTNTDAFLTKS